MVADDAFVGNISNGYQQSPANFPIASGGMSSIGLPRMTSQMVPTPGFNSNNNNSSINNQSSNIVGGLSTVESTTISQPQQQKQHVGCQNSRILHNLGSQMGSSIRSGLQHKTFGFPNGSLNGALGMIGNNMQIVNEPGTSGGYQTVTSFTNSSKPLQQHFDQHQQPLMQGNILISFVCISISFYFSNNESEYIIYYGDFRVVSKEAILCVR